MIPSRLNVVTLGVHDLAKVRTFYEALGWTSHSDGDEYARFETGGGILALFPAELLAEEANVPAGRPEGGAFGGVTLATVVASAEEVDAAIEAVEPAGGRVLAPPTDREWGGRSAYFADPEGNVWEVAWLPGAQFDDRDGLIWP